MGQLGNACRARAAECTLAASAAGWRGDNALKALYLALAQQWLEIAIIGDAADQERAIQQLSPRGGQAAHPRNEARRIAANIAKLTKLPSRRAGARGLGHGRSRGAA